MKLDEYQEKIVKYDAFKASGKVSEPGFVAKILGLCGESGEVAEKFKKIIRDKNGELSEEAKGEIVKELGDVLWYVTTLARYMNVSLEEVAEKNIEKLQSRLERDVLHGAGDNR
ncbi:MAG: nucleoside triphosphate pyrophosphohydrolase family protein [Elusimicrobiaceae bacterium]|nr:nucleoside triphosphate pyrophosphohydrolase family protein [Elusimicrobiaceae bacterium]